MERSDLQTGEDRHESWRALIAALSSIVAAGSCATLAGLLLTQFSSQFGWTTSALSAGVAINMLLYGLTAPFAIHAMEKYGIRRVSITALALIIAGSLLCMIPNQILFNVSWGLLVGLGVGSLTMAYGALVARMWFDKHQGTAAGILTASAVVGQFALLPLWARLSEIHGWRAPLIGCAVLAAVAIVVNYRLMPANRAFATESRASAGTVQKRFVDILTVLLSAFKSRVFWVLVLLFVICGATTNGILWSHFTPAAHDHGMPVTAASSVLFLVGIFNILGTVSSGWLCDRISPRLILAVVFVARGCTLFWLPLILSSEFDPPIVAFGVLFGILDVATVPPVIALCNRVFGREGPAIFGWINAFHQVGAGSMAAFGGVIRSTWGSYYLMWQLAGMLCVFAAVLVYTSRYKEQQRAVEEVLDTGTSVKPH
ncbi:MAG: MFS transporter [Aquisalimonadaceae bacterium]